MKRLTVVLAHSDFEKSVANRTIIKRLIEHYPTVDIRNIAQMYPTFDIDVKAEQQGVAKADVVLFQFPVNWYSCPAILKQWFDKVLEYGFAYGEGGNKLHGKTMLLSATAGGSRNTYTPIGYSHFYLDNLFNNIEATAYFCGMNYAQPVLGYSNLYIPGAFGSVEDVEEKANEQADRLIAKLDTLLKDD